MIKGTKVGLRAVETSDLELLKDWRNIAGFRRNFREHKELSAWNQAKWFERTMQSPGDFMFMIVDLQSGQPLGACGLLYTNWIIRSADFSFYIGANEWYIDEEGFAKDAADLLIRYGFDNLNLNKIWMELYEFDKVKFNFFTKLFGFKQDAVLRQNCFEGGRYWDSVIISLLKQDHTNTQ